jgi:hypothetical protein
MVTAISLHEQLDSIIQDRFSPHPFTQIAEHDDLPLVFSRFIGLSQATPYLLGGASKDMFLKKINAKELIQPSNEITTSVLSFLAWDETGGQQTIKEHSEQALHRILESKNYHSRILVEDLKTLIGKSLVAVYEDYSVTYFHDLLNNLSNTNDIERCAAIIAFEMHAEEVIKALWSSLDRLFPHVDKHSLKYFELHVGELNPVEEYHVEMTAKMVEMMVPLSGYEYFLNSFITSYKLNYDWSNETVYRR